MKLNHKNYYSKKNNYISCSKLKVFIKDKAYYKRKYIDYSIEQEMTDALIIGSAVDCLLTKGDKQFQKDFTVVARRSSNSEDTRIQINDTMLEKITGIVASVKRQGIWNDLKSKQWKKQTILTDDKLGICGMLDFLLVDGDHAIIVDLKTSNTIDPKKYYFLCWDYNYYLQAAFYTTLVKANYPDVKQVDFYHLAVEKDPDGIYNCALFLFMPQMIENETAFMLNKLAELRKETKFAPKSVGWNDKVLLAPLQ